MENRLVVVEENMAIEPRLGAIDNKPGFEWPQVASLLTIAGSVNGVVCKRPILLDGGATTSFIARSFVERAGIQCSQLAQSFKVKVADGRVMSCTNMVQRARLQLRSNEDECSCVQDLMVMEMLDGFDVILGRPFLIDSNARIDHGRDAVSWKPQRSKRQKLKVREIHEEHTTSSPSATTDEELGSMLRLLRLEPIDANAHRAEAKLNVVIGTATQRVLLQRSVENYTDQMKACEGKLPPDRGEFNHRIELKDSTVEPVKRRAMALGPTPARAMKVQLDELLKAGRIRRSKSPWGAPAFMVSKDNGLDMRMVVNYQALNELTVKNATSLPHIKELMARLAKARVFTKLDLKSGYNQVLMQPSDIEKTAFTTPFGHYEWTVMPFGESNAPASFVQLLNQLVFVDLGHDFLIIFVDDLLIFSEDEGQHVEHVDRVLKRLAEHQLWINPSKCEFMVDEVKFLGYHLKATDKGAFMMAQRNKVEAITAWPEPRTQTELRSFLGVANFCRPFIAGFASVAKPLTDLTQAKHGSKSASLQWNADAQRAFTELKRRLSEAPALAIPDEDKPFTIFTDASDFGVGAMLCQMNDKLGVLQPCGYMSAKLSGAMLNWTTFEKEFWAVISALDHWSMLLYWSKHRITVNTDHRALKFVLSQPVLNGRQSRWIEFLSRFKLNVKYLQGAKNEQADGLSRRPDLDDGGLELQRVRRAAADQQLAELEVHEGQNDSAILLALIADEMRVQSNGLLESLRAAYEQDERCMKMLKEPGRYHCTIDDGLLLNERHQIIVPMDAHIRNLVISEAHDAASSGHLGRDKTLARITENFHWSGLTMDVYAYVASCERCQLNKSSTQRPSGLLQPIPVPMMKAAVITVDFVGPLPTTARKKDFVMVVTDKFTKRVWYCATRQEITAREAASLLFARVITHQGLPEAIVSDRDTRFTAAVWKELWEQCGTKLAMSTSFHPETNGATEQHNKVMQEMLRSYVKESQKDWDLFLPVLEIAYNSSLHASTGFTPYELDIGMQPRLPIDIALSNSSKKQNTADFLDQWRAKWILAQKHVRIAQEKQREQANRHRKNEEFARGQFVLLQLDRGPQRAGIGVSGKLGPKFEGPYEIIELHGDVNVKLKLNDGDQRHNVFHVSQLERFIVRDEKRYPANAERAEVSVEHGKSRVNHKESADGMKSSNVSEESINQSINQMKRYCGRQRRLTDHGPFISY